MKPTVLILTLFCLTTLLFACSQEEPAPPAATKAPAIQAAQQVSQVAKINIGQKIYASYCGSCHNTGLMGAPTLGDKGAWASRINKGTGKLVENSINGIGSMPPKGGHAKLDKLQIKAAVEYMVKQSQ